jgi:hypothetical protein
MLGESMTARNSSSWWISIYLLRLAPLANAGGLARESPALQFAYARECIAFYTVEKRLQQHPRALIVISKMKKVECH